MMMIDRRRYFLLLVDVVFTCFLLKFCLVCILHTRTMPLQALLIMMNGRRHTWFCANFGVLRCYRSRFYWLASELRSNSCFAVCGALLGMMQKLETLCLLLLGTAVLLSSVCCLLCKTCAAWPVLLLVVSLVVCVALFAFAANTSSFFLRCILVAEARRQTKSVL